MLSTPYRFGLRELGLSKGRAALVAGILGLQASALTGGIIGFESLFATRDHYYETLRIADLDVHIVPATPEEMPSLEELARIPGVAEVERRFVSMGYVEQGPEARPLPVVVHYLDPTRHPRIDDVAISRGAFLSPADPDSAVIDRLFAEHHHLSLGDKLVVNPNRFAQRFTVAGVAISPEYLVPTANPDMMIPDKGSLGIVFASRKKLDQLFADELYNDLLFRFTPGADPKVTTKRVVEALDKLDVERVIPKEANFGHRYIEEVLGGSRIFMPTTAAILALIASIAAMVSVRRLLVARCREIGGLLALGWEPSQLVRGLLVFGIVPGILGALVGVPGAMAFGWNLAHTNAEVAGMPPPLMVWSPGYFAIGGASAIAVGLISVLVPALALTKLDPMRALRGADEVRFVGLPRLFERLVSGSVSARYAMRNLFRRLRLSIATVTLVSLSVAMPAALLTVISSWHAWADAHVDGLRWDLATSFKVPLDERQAHTALAVRGVVAYEGHLQKHATLLREGAAEQEVRVRGLPVPTRLSPLTLVAGSYFSAPNAPEAILNTSFSRGDRPAEVGDLVTVVYKGKRHQLRVVGTISDGTLQTMFVPLETAQRMFDEVGKVSGAHVLVGDGPPPPAPTDEALPPPGPRPEAAESIDVDAPAVAAPPPDPSESRIDAAAVQRRLLSNEIVTAVQAKEDVRAATGRYLGVFHSMTIPLIGQGGILAFFFVMSMLSVLLLEREPEYATLRTMGYGASHLARMVLTEVAVLAAAGLVASLATWVGVAYVLAELMAKAWFRIPVVLTSHDWSLVAGPIGVLLLCAAVPGIAGLLRIDLAASMRARSMG
jgi:putative ABC transport system permease protein